MSDPDPKRRRMGVRAPTVRTLPFSNLPPDVIVSEILSHIDSPRESGGSVKYFGYFCRDVLRYPWFLYRRIAISMAQILAGLKVHVNPNSALPGQAESLCLPYMKRKQIQHIGVFQPDYYRSPRTRPLLAYIITKTRSFMRPEDVTDDLTELAVKLRVKKFLLRIFGGAMPVLESIDALGWRFLAVFDVYNEKNMPNISTIRWESHAPYIFPDELKTQRPVESIKRLLNVSYRNLRFRWAYSIDALFNKFGESFPKLHTVEFCDWARRIDLSAPPDREVPLINPGERGFMDFVTTHPIQALCVPRRYTVSDIYTDWPMRITTKLALTASADSNLPVPPLHPTLTVAQLGSFVVPIPHGVTARRIVFHKCVFESGEFTLSDRVDRVEFRDCTFPGSSVTVTAPNLKHLHLMLVKSHIGPGDQRFEIRSDTTLETLNVRNEGCVIIGNWQELTLTANRGAKILTLDGILPSLIGLTDTVTDLRIGDGDVLFNEGAPPNGYDFTRLEAVYVDETDFDVSDTLLKEANKAKEYFVERGADVMGIEWENYKGAELIRVNHMNPDYGPTEIPGSVHILGFLGQVPNIQYHAPNVHTLVLQGVLDQKDFDPEEVRNWATFPKLERLVTSEVLVPTITAKFEEVIEEVVILERCLHSFRANKLYLYKPPYREATVFRDMARKKVKQLVPLIGVTILKTLYVPVEWVKDARTFFGSDTVTVERIPLGHSQTLDPFFNFGPIVKDDGIMQLSTTLI